MSFLKIQWKSFHILFALICFVQIAQVFAQPKEEKKVSKNTDQKEPTIIDNGYKIVTEGSVKYYVLNYQAEPSDTLSKIFRKFTGRSKVLFASHPSTVKTLSENKHVKDWENINQGEVITVYLSNDVVDLSKILHYVEKNNVVLKGADDWKMSLFYMMSGGSFSETLTTSEGSVSSTQDSPLTVGYSAFRKFKQDYSYSGSLYISVLDIGVSDKDEIVSIPWEFGLNSYVGYKKEKWPVEIYGGLDIERFSSFNSDELSSGEALSTREQLVTYLTFGTAQTFNIYKQLFFSKVSFSKSLFTSESRASLINPEVFSGFKYMLYLNTKITDKWFVHMLYKQHILEGATELSISRIGIGIGYAFSMSHANLSGFFRNLWPGKK